MGAHLNDLSLVLVFFVYGLAFFAMGLAIALEARRSSAIHLAGSLKYLAAFGLVHSGVEWLDMSLMIQGDSAASVSESPLRIARLLLLAASAVCLLMFGTRLITASRAGWWRLQFLPWLLSAAWLVSFVIPHLEPVARAVQPMGGELCLECHWGSSGAYLALSRGWAVSADVWARYLLYFPGSALAGLALLYQRRRFLDLGLPRIASYSVYAAVAFAANAVMSGLVVPPTSYIPASLLNYATFSAVLGFPPQVFRAVLAVVIAFFVVRILSVFEIERARVLERANQERFAAQQEALEAQRQAQVDIEGANRQLEAKVQERTRELEEMHARLQNLAVLEERDRIAREMHDSLAQVLGYLGLRSDVASTYLGEGKIDKAGAELRDMQRVAEDAYADVREAILGLRTNVGHSGFVPTLEEYLRKFSLTNRIKVQLAIEDPTIGFRPDAEIQLIRIIQEALANVRKHAQASHVLVRMSRDDGSIVISVRDDGKGFDPNAPVDVGHFGLTTMRERAHGIGGSVTVESAASRGTQVTLVIPDQPENDGNDRKEREGRDTDKNPGS